MSYKKERKKITSYHIIFSPITNITKHSNQIHDTPMKTTTTRISRKKKQKQNIGRYHKATKNLKRMRYCAKTPKQRNVFPKNAILQSNKQQPNKKASFKKQLYKQNENQSQNKQKTNENTHKKKQKEKKSQKHASEMSRHLTKHKKQITIFAKKANKKKIKKLHHEKWHFGQN